LGTQPLYALTCPLLTTSSGAKMGKTASGAVWLNAELLSAYEYWQYWRNAEDADVGRFLRLYTTLPMAEVERLERLGGAEINEAKKTLATEATALLHGGEAATRAAETSRKTFEGGGVSEGLPSVTIPRSELEGGVGLLKALVQAGLASSNGEARRAVQGGGVRVNDAAVDDERLVLTNRHVEGNGVVKLSLGRKKHVLLKPE
jgi:tyrosyl-tRNA synthetase